MRKVITPSELHTKNENELSALFRKVSQDLTGTKAGSAERRNALASLENIQRARACRQTLRPKPPGF
ncbi:MAG: hypothetical protein OI74_12485 [Gammaproteobacteria bacterium (ex Lamellibrachia satsuma)]|nr:MAG: hypothetical protein HPY30_01055 [Gammaproteobacteria bacterium (ex Lamellibrachia satsuma)]RRS32044.1 MAG: hypothetical protein OI74_12485 [Gammaproteobacteria bacterium (ex Lamellibrachia satsuma)]